MFPKLSSNPYYPFLKAYLFGLIFFSLSRLGLIFWQLDAVAATDKLLNIIVQGVRVDLIQLGLMFLIPLLIFPLSFINGQTKNIYSAFLRFWIIISFIILFIIEACSITFINEYNTRPNVLFLEYLKYPREVFEMLFKGFTLDAILVVGSVLLVSRLIILAFRKQNQIEDKFIHLVIWPIILVLMLISIRSSFGHRPANPAMFAITDNAMVNSLVLNSPYSVFYAAYSMKHEASASKVYGKMDIDKIYSLTDQNGPAEYPTQKTLTPSYQGKPKNIVILLQESLGATFVESLGGAPVTPNLEKLKSEGIWFSQLYATGTRSVRGIEAVVSGFPPTPAQSTVKLPLSQSNFFTLASLLNEKNYETSFIYGGEAHFDNMRNFFTGNGFKKIIEQKDFTNPIFKGSWGASDQDVYQKAHEEFLERHSQNQPFFSLVFTSSNHAPFEFPEGVIDLYEQPQATEKNAVKYADHALGEFIEKAKQSDYWKDTIFLIVADHDIRVRGDFLIPIKNFHIPGLIMGGGINPKVISSITSQIDLPVTILSLAGIHAKHPMIGQDMSAIDQSYKGRAIMQYYDNFAWMEQDELFVLQPNQEIFYGKYDFINNKIIPSDKNNINYDKQLAHALLPSILYSQKLYRLPPQ
jgi:phosphoglycerol transferase MdoB-like AlkP superfamily enzyme